MTDSILTALQQPFFIRSIAVVVLLAIVFPLYGNIVIIRNEANIAHTFAHLGLLGVAIGLWFDRPIMLTIIGSVIGTVIFLMIVSSNHGSSGAHGAQSVVSNEIGAQLGLVGAILLVSQMSGYKADISSYLFGDILLLGPQDVWTIAGVVAVCVVLYLLFRRKRYAISLNQGLAVSKGISLNSSYILYLIGVGLLIGGAMKIIGVLLVSAFLLLPSSIGKLVASNRRQRNRISIAACLILSILALFLSWHLDMPSGASIVGVLIAVYLIVLIVLKIQTACKL